MQLLADTAENQQPSPETPPTHRTSKDDLPGSWRSIINNTMKVSTVAIAIMTLADSAIASQEVRYVGWNKMSLVPLPHIRVKGAETQNWYQTSATWYTNNTDSSTSLGSPREATSSWTSDHFQRTRAYSSTYFGTTVSKRWLQLYDGCRAIIPYLLLARSLTLRLLTTKCEQPRYSLIQHPSSILQYWLRFPIRLLSHPRERWSVVVSTIWLVRMVQLQRSN